MHELDVLAPDRTGPASPVDGHAAATVGDAFGLRRFHCLDGLRGIAAILVVLLHVGDYFQLAVKPAHAYLAVDFFFMLSGFVIAHAYDGRLRDHLGPGPFLRLRLIRLYPMIALGIALGTLALLGRAALVGDVTAGSVLQAAAGNALLLPTPAFLYIRPWAFPINGPLWSLVFEVWTNLIYAAAFRALTTARLWFVLAVGAMLTTWACLRYGMLNVGFLWTDFGLGGVRILFPFVAGVLMRRLFLRGATSAMAGPAAALLLLTILLVPGQNGLYDAGAVLLAFPLILHLAARAQPSVRLDRLWRRLGSLSYPLYATHYPFVVVVSTLAHQHNLAGPALAVAALATVVGVIAFAMTAEAVYDRPVRRALGRAVAAAKPRPAAAATSGSMGRTG